MRKKEKWETYRKDFTNLKIDYAIQEPYLQLLIYQSITDEEDAFSIC